MDSNALAASLRILGDPAPRHPLRESLQQVIDACVQVFAVDGCGLMVADSQSILRYAVASDPRSRVLEDIQLETGEGPCVDTFVRDELTLTEDLAVDDRWPTVSRAMGKHGVHGMLGAPVRLSGITVGSLDVFVDRPHAWDRSEQQALARYADVVGSITEVALAAQQAGELAEQLNYALDHRVPIERGIGYLMGRDRLGHAEAFNRMRRSARNTRRKIGEVAEELLDAGRLPDEA